MVFDTTASNTDHTNGACILLKQQLGRNLLHLACRHHVLELLLKPPFETCMGPTSGRDVLIFKRFQKQWKTIDKERFLPGVHDVEVQAAVKDDAKDALAFAHSQMKINSIRNHYREFLVLVIMFLGGTLPSGNKFRALGPIHHARWMAKAIYSLKIFLFKDQFTLTSYEEFGFGTVCIFIVLWYQMSWFTASRTIEAPRNDLELLKKLADDQDHNVALSPVSTTVFDKFRNQLWY